MKERILDVAAQLIQMHGLKKFTVDEIAATLKISKKTIYQYYSGKDDIIHAYFETVTHSDRAGIEQALASGSALSEKLHAIVHSSHRYTLPVSLLNEAKLFFPEEWQSVEDLKQFKLDAMESILKQASGEGILKPEVHFPVLCRMMQEISNMFTDSDFLVENKLKASEAMDRAVDILLNGILK